MGISEFIPKMLVPITNCFRVINKLHDGKNVEVVVCTNNGHLLEISKGNLVSSCYVVEHSISEIHVYYQKDLIPDQESTYYILRTQLGKMVIVHKDQSGMSVHETHDNIEKIRIFDFHNVGYPQVGFKKSNTTNFEIADFSIRTLVSNDDISSQNSEVNKLLNRNLHGIKLYIDDLEEELNSMGDAVDEESSSGGLQKHGSYHKCGAEKPNHTVIGTWQHLHFDSWIIGVQFYNSGQTVLSQFELLVTDDEGAAHEYLALIPTSDNTWPGYLPCSRLPPQSQALLVCVSRVPDFLKQSSHRKQCTIVCDGVASQRHSFVLTAADVVRGNLNAFGAEAQQTGSELVACLAASVATSLTVTLALPLPVSLDVVLERLGFSSVGDHLIRRAQSLCGVLAHIRRHTNVAWDLSLLTRRPEDVLLLVNALYDSLPLGTTILPS